MLPTIPPPPTILNVCPYPNPSPFFFFFESPGWPAPIDNANLWRTISSPLPKCSSTQCKLLFQDCHIEAADRFLSLDNTWWELNTNNHNTRSGQVLQTVFLVGRERSSPLLLWRIWGDEDLGGIHIVSITPSKVILSIASENLLFQRWDEKILQLAEVVFMASSYTTYVI